MTVEEMLGTQFSKTCLACERDCKQYACVTVVECRLMVRTPKEAKPAGERRHEGPLPTYQKGASSPRRTTA